MFPKDIWSLIFRIFEKNFDPETLNSLSLTCKKLYQIDKEHKNMYLRYLEEKYGFDIVSYFAKGRMDYLLLDKYLSIGTLDIISETKTCFINSYLSNFPKLFTYLKSLKVESYEELKNMNSEELCLKTKCDIVDLDTIKNSFVSVYNIQAHDFICLFYLLKNNKDLVNSVMEILYYSPFSKKK